MTADYRRLTIHYKLFGKKKQAIANKYFGMEGFGRIVPKAGP